MSLGDHLEELRKRLMLGLVGPLVIMIVVAVFFGDAILAFLLEPGHRALEAAGFEPTLPHRHPAEVFNAWMRVCIVSGLIVGIPWLFYQLWMFVAPGLYPHERKVVYRLIPGSILLSAVGVLYLYFLLLPVILDFLLWFSGSLPEPPPPAFAVAPYEGTLPQAPILEADPEVRAPGDWWIRKREVGSLGKPRIVYDLAIDIEGIVRTAPLGRANLSAPLWMLGEYIGFVTLLALAFAVGFQMPLVVFTLAWVGVVGVDQLRRARKYVLLGCVTVGAFLTPPDVTSQLGLAIPMYLLYELGIVLVRWSGPRRPARGPDVST